MESPIASPLGRTKPQPLSSPNHQVKDTETSKSSTASSTPVKKDNAAVSPTTPTTVLPTPPSQSPTSPTTIIPPQEKDRDKCDNLSCFNQALIVCGICNDAPHYASDPPTAQYCSISCQKVDLARHIAVCDRMLDRTTLFRVMEVAMKQLYIYREISWHAFELRSLEGKVGDDGQECVVVRGWNVDDPHWPDDHRQFPEHLMRTREDREALLVFLAKIDAVTMASEWIHGLLGGIVVEILKVVHEVKNAPRKMVLEDVPPEIDHEVSEAQEVRIEVEPSPPTWEEMNCELLKVRLRSGEEYAIDLSAAQYGYFNTPVIEWRDYERTRTATLTTTHPPIFENSIRAADFRVSTQIRAFHYMIEDANDKDLLVRHLGAVNLYLMEWQFEGKMSLKQLWQTHETIYRQKMQNLCDFVEYKLNRFSKANGTRRGRVLARKMRLKGDRSWDFNRNL